MAIARSKTNFILTTGGYSYNGNRKRQKKRFLISWFKSYNDRHKEGIKPHLKPKTWVKKLRPLSKEEIIIRCVRETDKRRWRERMKSRKRRAKRHMTRYRYEWFMTVTQGDRSEGIDVHADYINDIFAMLEAEEIAFICVPERQKDGSLHWHLFLSKKPSFMNKHTYDQKRKQTVYFSEKINNECGRNEIIELDDFFSYGYSSSVNYMTKYITKQGTKITYSKKPPNFNVANYLRENLKSRHISPHDSMFRTEYNPKRDLKIEKDLRYYLIGTEYVELAVKLGKGIEFDGEAWRFVEPFGDNPKTRPKIPIYEQLSF